MLSSGGETPGRAGRAFLLATVFCSGAAVMVVEMTAVRVLQPFFGSTTPVWTNVIAVVLAALAAGYAIGGRLADLHPHPGLFFALVGAGGLLAAAGAPAATAVSGLLHDTNLDFVDSLGNLVRGSLGTSLILFAPPVLVLGMVSPFAIRLLSRDGVGRAAGHVYAVSTVGSILGTYLPAFLLVPRLGSRGSLLVAAGALLAPAAAGLVLFARARGRAAVAALLLLGAGGALVALTDPRPNRPLPQLRYGGKSRLIEEAESGYQYLSVRENEFPDGAVEEVLTMNESLRHYHSYRLRGYVLTGLPHHDEYAVLPMLLDRPPGADLRLLMLGLACGIDAAQWRHFWGDLYRLRIVGAEIDPEIVALGRRHFDLPGPGADWLAAHAVDGRTLLRSLPAGDRFHAIVLDAFSNELSVPFHLATREFFAECRTRLEPGGILAMNVNARDASSRNLLAVGNTLATVFGACFRTGAEGEGNYRLLARLGPGGPDFARLAPSRLGARFGPRRDVPEWPDLVSLAASLPEHVSRILPREEAMVLTDDHAPLEWLSDRFNSSDDPGRTAEGQTRFLLLAGAAWAVLLSGLGLVLRARARPRAG